MRRYYNSETKKLLIQLETDSLDLSVLMSKHQQTDYGDNLAKLVNHINALAPQLPQGFGGDSYKTLYLRRAVKRHECSLQPISHLTTARNTFTQFNTSLNGTLQLK